MSKDTINPKRYTVVEKLGKDLKEGDEFYRHTKGWDKWEHDGTFAYINQHTIFLCRVPSSPVMSKPLNEVTIEDAKKIASAGYNCLSGTSGTWELTDDDLGNDKFKTLSNPKNIFSFLFFHDQIQVNNEDKKDWDVHDWDAKYLCYVEAAKLGYKIEGLSGYLIGTRSIVPEMTDEEIEKYADETLKGFVLTYEEKINFIRGLTCYRNWLRSQINK